MDPTDCFFDLGLEDDLRSEFSYCLATDLARQAPLENDTYMLGLSDAGAHLTLLADHAYTTYFLGRWIRERRLMPLERAIQLAPIVPPGLQGEALQSRAIVKPPPVENICPSLRMWK